MNPFRSKLISVRFVPVLVCESLLSKLRRKIIFSIFSYDYYYYQSLVLFLQVLINLKG
jgi:hypothetical protein